MTLISNQQSPFSSGKRSAEDLLYEYGVHINEWPSRWEISEEDLLTGKAVTEQFKLFLVERIRKDLSKKTIKNNATYLWALGGELIRQINEDDSERQLTAKELILKYVNESGGPYWRHASDEAEHARYDSVCKQLFKFITTKTG